MGTISVGITFIHRTHIPREFYRTFSQKSSSSVWMSRRRRRAERAGALVKCRWQGFLANLLNCCYLTEQTLTFPDLPPSASPKPGLVNTSWIAHYIRRAFIFSTWTASLSSPGQRENAKSACYRNVTACYVRCTNLSVQNKTKHAALTQKHFFIKCKPLYLQQELSSFILVGVYFPPQAWVRRYNSWLTR